MLAQFHLSSVYLTFLLISSAGLLLASGFFFSCYVFREVHTSMSAAASAHSFRLERPRSEEGTLAGREVGG
jgi:hypothetical protein